METNTGSKHLTDDKKEHHEKKRIKLDRSTLGLNLAQPSPVSNGVKSETKVPRHEEVQGRTENEKTLSISLQREIVKSQEKPSLKRPASNDECDNDNVPLVARSKQNLSSGSNTPTNQLHKLKSPVKDSASNNDIKKIKKSRPETNLNVPKVEKVMKAENSDGVKKIKTGSGLTTNQADGIKKTKSDSGSTKTDGAKKLKLDPGSPKIDGMKKPKSESNSSTKPDGVKKIKSESGLSSPSKTSEKIVKLEGSSTVKSDSTKKMKPELEASVKIKSESGLKTPDGVKKSKEGSLPQKADDLKKKKQTSSSSQKVDGIKTKEGSSVKTEKDKSKTTSSSKTDGQSKDSSKLNSPKTDGIKKEKQKTSAPGNSKPEGTPKSSDTAHHNKDSSGLSSPKVDGIRKEKHKSSSSGSSESENSKSSDNVKQSKDSSGLTSPKVDGAKKEKQQVSSAGSPKVDDIKKIKTESGGYVSSSGEKKVGEKKVKAESSSTSIKSEKKTKSERSVSGSPKLKVEVSVKKMKIESGSSSSPKLSSGIETTKTAAEDNDDDEVPLAARVKVKKEPSSKKSTPSKDRKRKVSDGDDDDDYKPLKKLKKKSDVGMKDSKKGNVKKEKVKKENDGSSEKRKEGKAKEKKEEEVWKWWEEEKHPEGIKWLTLEHKGPYFPPDYEPLPDTVNFYYDGQKVKLSLKSEEVAGFYAKMLDHDYTSKKIFNDNFFQDWRKEMTNEERALITKLSKCDFKEIHAYYVQKNEERKNMSKEEKQKIKEKNEEILQEYGYCIMDKHKERVGNFKIEPPGLFRGRGDHPKQGKLKRRLQAKDVTINIGKDAKVPDPPEGQRWKAIQHDNKVTWLACWIENIQGSYKYVMLNPTSRIKGEKDWQKYETARNLKNHIHKIREDYTNDWKAKEMRIRQRGVALYFIDKLALRAGHEKDEDTADTVGCCSLRYEHIKLHKKLGEKEYVVEFDFLGKDSIHYHNVVEVEKKVFKNLELFQQGKSEGDDLFDRLSTTSLNKYLSELMEGLSAKVFRTYNASMTLQDQLNKLELEDNVPAKVLGYNRANRAVAILCNHQRSVPKTFEQSMSNLQQKIDDKRKAIKDAKNDLKDLKHEARDSESVTLAKKIEKKKTAIERLKEQLFKLEVSQTDKNENKEIALGTSKLNYLDPRISIAWCLKNNVPLEKIYNKTQRQKFAWAIDMTEEDFVF